MLTIPKLTHTSSHRKNKSEDQLIFDSVNLQKKLLTHIKNTQKRIQIDFNIDSFIKNKQNILKTPQKYNYSEWMNDIDLSNKKNPINKLNQIVKNISHNTNYKKQINQIKKHNELSAQVAHSLNRCFSPKYQKERQKNKFLLQSLKLENQKYKKLLLQNEFFMKKQNNIEVKQFQIFPNVESNKKIQKKLIIPQRRKALEQMTNLTKSFIMDDNQNIKSNISIKNHSPKEIIPNITINKQKSIKDFDKIKFLGKGNFGQVHLVRHKLSNFICAMKTIKKSFILQENVVHQISRQIRIHLSLKHLNIIGFYGFFDDSENVYLLTQYATGGELYQKLKENYRMPQTEVVPIVKNILQGLKMIHSLNFIHRDLKPENVIFQFGIAKICDLGWATQCSFNETKSSFCGTPLYLSPQMIKKQNYDQTIDVWALGILTYELMVGKVPFNIWSEYDLQQIVDKQIVFPTSYVDMTQTSIDFIKKCLTKNATERFKIQKLYNHSFIQDIKDGYFNVQVYDGVENIFS